MVYLCNSLLAHVYSYDSTYRDLYDKCTKEMVRILNRSCYYDHASVSESALCHSWQRYEFIVTVSCSDNHSLGQSSVFLCRNHIVPGLKVTIDNLSLFFATHLSAEVEVNSIRAMYDRWQKESTGDDFSRPVYINFDSRPRNNDRVFSDCYGLRMSDREITSRRNGFLVLDFYNRSLFDDLVVYTTESDSDTCLENCIVC